MKSKFLSVVALAAIFGMSLTSCGKDDKTEPTPEPDENVNLTGDIAGERTLKAGTEYKLTGPVIVKDGGVLTIPAGTTIKAEEGFDKYILVAQGGKININGTSDKPVVITSDEENAGAGYWGGLIINGKAPLAGGDTGSTEINADYQYGGTNANDSSGSITYLKLISTGARSTADVEHNGITLNGVGSGTTIQNVYVKDCADDGVEFFGGTVKVKNLLVVNTDDDMFDVTQGWKGTLENCYGVWEDGFISTEGDPRGVESDGNLDGKFPTQEGQSDFTIRNMTIDLRLAASTEDGKYMHDAIKVRRGAKATILNALVKGSGQVKDFIDLSDKKGNGNAETSINVTNNLSTNISGKEVKGTGNVTFSNDNSGCDKSNFSWTGYDLTESTPQPNENVNLTGDIAGEKTLKAGTEYKLTGPVIVKDGGVLTIPAGTTIKAEEGFDKYILVAQGGKININGTSDNPVVLTSDEENAGAGYWGGLIINGKAPLAGGDTGSTEINADYQYGGTNEDDSSGNITYLKLISTGARSTADVEHNGLTLNGVGNGTTIQNVYVKDCADDGVEFFGGTVKVKNLLVVNTDDDMFDITQGWKGTLENCYGVWEDSYTSTEGDPRGVESDGNLDGKFPTQDGQSDFTIKNMTIDLRLAASTEEGKYMHDAIKVRRGAKATILNALVKGSGQVKDLIDLTDKKGDANVETSINITNSLANDISGKEVKENHKGDVVVEISNDNSGCDKSNFSWTGYSL